MGNEELVKKMLNGTALSGTATHDDSSAMSGGISTIFNALNQHKWGILLLFILGLCAGFYKAISEVPIYQARLTMAVEPNTSRSPQQALFDPFAHRFYETQYDLLKSRSVARKVVDSLNLAERKEVDQMLLRPSALQQIKFAVFGLVGIETIGNSPTDGAAIENNPVGEEQLETKRKYLTSLIQNGVSVRGGDKTNLVTVTFNSTNPIFAADVANELVTAYIDLGLESQLSRTEQTSRWLSERIVDLKESLDIAQAKLQNFLLQEGMLDLDQSRQIASNELLALNQAYLDSRKAFEELSKRYGGKHPKITEARAEMQAAKRRLDSRSKNATSTKAKEFELAQLEREVELNRELYEAFLAKFREADLSSGSQIASARIVDKALPPGGPIHPNKQRIVLTWGIGGLLLGFALAMLREQLDTRFKSVRSVEEKLKLPLLGVIQKLSDGKKIERLYAENNRSVFAEAINHIRTGILYSNVDHPPQTILVTSSVQSEGKTTVSMNLALSFAQLGSTLLIDADLRRPRIKTLIDAGHNYGLVDYVAGAVSLKDCVVKDTELENLYIMNCGTTPPNPLELLSSEKMHSILESLKQKFKYIVIDTAPILPASDAVVVGRYVDSLVMVVQADRTTHHMARDAVRRLSSANVAVSGLVLSQANLKRGGSAYYGSYGGGYGGYYGYGAYGYSDGSNETKS
jgi:capsular exopolysaccharide synthesis family protein